MSYLTQIFVPAFLFSSFYTGHCLKVEEQSISGALKNCAKETKTNNVEIVKMFTKYDEPLSDKNCFLQCFLSRFGAMRGESLNVDAIQQGMFSDPKETAGRLVLEQRCFNQILVAGYKMDGCKVAEKFSNCFVQVTEGGENGDTGNKIPFTKLSDLVQYIYLLTKGSNIAKALDGQSWT